MTAKTEKRVLIVDDEGRDCKCEEVRALIHQLEMQYEVAITLEEATEKIFSEQKVLYDAIILDYYFPEKEEKQATGREYKKFLDMMEEYNSNIPVMMFGIMLKKPDYEFVVDWMHTWEVSKLQNFLEDVK